MLCYPNGMLIAGAHMSVAKGFEEAAREAVEVKKLSVIHFNDSLKPFNSRRDRRAGEICRNSRNSTYFGDPGGHPFAPRGFRGVTGVVARVTYSHLRV